MPEDLSTDGTFTSLSWETSGLSPVYIYCRQPYIPPNHSQSAQMNGAPGTHLNSAHH